MTDNAHALTSLEAIGDAGMMMAGGLVLRCRMCA
jgi:hypothetical protein